MLSAALLQTSRRGPRVRAFEAVLARLRRRSGARLSESLSPFPFFLSPAFLYLISPFFRSFTVLSADLYSGRHAGGPTRTLGSTSPASRLRPLRRSRPFVRPGRSDHSSLLPRLSLSLSPAESPFFSESLSFLCLLCLSRGFLFNFTAAALLSFSASGAPGPTAPVSHFWLGWTAPLKPMNTHVFYGGVNATFCPYDVPVRNCTGGATTCNENCTINGTLYLTPSFADGRHQFAFGELVALTFVPQLVCLLIVIFGCRAPLKDGVAMTDFVGGLIDMIYTWVNFSILVVFYFTEEGLCPQPYVCTEAADSARDRGNLLEQKLDLYYHTHALGDISWHYGRVLHQNVSSLVHLAHEE